MSHQPAVRAAYTRRVSGNGAHEMTSPRAEERITRDPAVLGGKPIIRGTRIAVDLVVDRIESGVPHAQILKDYPNLTAEDLNAAVEFAAAQKENIEVRRWQAMG